MLIQSGIEDLDELLEGAKLPAKLRQQLARKFTTAKEAKETLAAFKEHTPTGGEDGEIIDQLKEIAKDLKFAKSKRGQLILKCNEMVPDLYKTIRDDWGETDIYIGAHTEHLAVTVAGKLKDPNHRDDILALAGKAFDYPILDRMTK